MAELSELLQFALMERWRWLRDDARRRGEVAACVDFAYDAGLLTAEQRELWVRRLDSCPGHDDEGGRSWCAYCGTMPSGAKA